MKAQAAALALRTAIVLAASAIVALAPLPAQAETVTVGQAVAASNSPCANNLSAAQTGVESGASYTFPSAGTVSSWSTRAWASGGAGVVRSMVWRPNGSKFDAVFVSEPITVPSSLPAADIVTPISPAVAVQAGDVLGLYTATGNVNCFKATASSADTRVASSGSYAVGDSITPRFFPDRQRLSIAAEFTPAVAAAPTITSISPATGPADSGTEVTITGTGFDGATSVLFGGAPADSFIVDSSTQIRALTPFASPGTVDVSVTTPAGTSENTSADNFTFDTSDHTNPAVLIFVAPDQPNPTNAGPIKYEVTFNEPVTGFTRSDMEFTGPPGTTVQSVTDSGDGQAYTVLFSGMTASGLLTAWVPAGAAQDAAGNPNDRSAAPSVVYDEDAPSVSITRASGQASTTSTAPIVFSVHFSEPVKDGTFTSSDVALSSTAGAVRATVLADSSGAAGQDFRVEVTGMSGSGTVTANVPAGVATDKAGNGNTAASSPASVAYDNTGPTASIAKASGQDDPTNTDPVKFTVTFDENVDGFTASDVDLTGSPAGSTATVTGDSPGTTFTVSVSGMTADGDVKARVMSGAVTDSAGNASTASSTASVRYDGTRPSVTINPASSQTDPANGDPVKFDVVFSEPVSGFTADDVALSGTAGPSTKQLGNPSNDNKTFVLLVGNMASDGTVVATIATGGAKDAAGNTNGAPTGDDTIDYDGTDPSVTINPASSPGDPTNTDPVKFDVVFSEAVSGLDEADVTLGGTAGASTKTVSNPSNDKKTFVLTVGGMTHDGTVIATIAAGGAKDAAGNTNDAATGDDTIDYDATKPTVTINQASGQDGTTTSGPIEFAVRFSEPVDGFTADDVVLSGPAAAGATVKVSGSGDTYTVTVSGLTANGELTASLAPGGAKDAAGNSSAASTSTDNTVTFYGKGDGDGDGLSDAAEFAGGHTLRVRTASGLQTISLKSDIDKADTDGDGLTDGQEVNGVSVKTRIYRFKHHRLVRVRISRFFSDPSNADTDGDGLGDSREVRGFRTRSGVCRPDPANFDTDDAKYSDGFEIRREKPRVQNPCRPGD